MSTISVRRLKRPMLDLLLDGFVHRRPPAALAERGAFSQLLLSKRHAALRMTEQVHILAQASAPTYGRPSHGRGRQYGGHDQHR